jgi:hypothetical protein
MYKPRWGAFYKTSLEPARWASGHLTLFLRLFHIMKHNKLISKKDIQTILKHAGHDLPSLESKFRQLSNAVLDLEIRKKELTFLHKCHIHPDLLPNAVKILPRLKLKSYYNRIEWHQILKTMLWFLLKCLIRVIVIESLTHELVVIYLSKKQLVTEAKPWQASSTTT